MAAGLRDKETLRRRLAPHREGWGGIPRQVAPEPAGPGEESVWDYPRPPKVREARGEVVAVVAGREIARSRRALEVIETAGAPVPYLPPDDVDFSVLEETGARSLCEWKGEALYYDIVAGDERRRQAAFSYPDPLDDLGRGYSRIAGWISFYPAKLDAAWIGDRPVTPQPGGVYAGWVTGDIKGPIKGAPGTQHW